MKPFVTKWIGGILLMFLSLLNLQAQTDTLCNPNENKKLFGELYFNYGSVVNAYTAFNRSNFTMGQPLVSVESMLSQTNQSGFGVYSPFLLPPQPPILLATQGDFKDRIRLSWNVNPLSPAPTGFTIYRDGSYLTDLGEDVRQFLDFNVQAGEYYEYSIIAKNVFGSGSEYKFVGFVNPNGVVSGKIETNSNNPVPGVEVRLTPLTGSSMSFDGVDDELCVTYNDKLPTDKFTVSAYVKLGDGNSETGIIDWGSSLNKNWWITTTNSPTEGKGYIFHIGNGTGSDSLKYFIPNEITNPELPNQWHQITMVYNGTALSVMVDGNFVGTKPAVISRTKNYLNIGGKIGSTGFFKGKIDDVRIYNRPLTQTEVRATKNRSVSKTENGLVAYWKMDEGVGQKVFDNSSVPTIANIYGGAKFSTDIPEVYNAGVSDVTGYYVIDGINYSTTESFRATPIRNFDFNSAVEFNAADKSYGNLTNYDIPDTATVEVLFHPFDLKSRQTVLSKGNLYELYVDNSKLYLNLNGNVSDLGTIKAKYYHVAVAMDNTHGTAKVYLEGELKTTVSFTGTSNWAVGNPWLIATNSTDAITGKFYTGLIDEVAIYKTALPQNEIQRHFVVGIPQDSTTALLYSYFDLNEASDVKVYDYAAISFGATVPREGILTKANWSNNVRRSESKAHEFEPNVRVVNLNTSNTAVGNIDFRDVSTVNVSGYVRFANTFCFEDKVEILVNDKSFFPPIITDKDGKWSADFEPGASIKLKATYKDHLFSPSFFELRKLQAPKAGIVFLDNTKRTIRGQVAGNEVCRKSIIPSGSRVVVKIETLDGCFSKTDTLRNPDGKFVFSNLPARAFRVSVVEHSNSVIYNYFQIKGGQEVDLRDATADTTDFIYVAPPQVQISEPVANACGIKLMNQSSTYKTTIKVFEQYDGGVCYLDNADLTISNAISDADQFDTTMVNGKFEYSYKAGYPNLISPYQKTMQVVATVNSASAQALIKASVLGKKGRASTFTSKSPVMPFLILRDPPGDGSTAFMEKNTTSCFSINVAGNFGIASEASVGVTIGSEVTTSVGVGAETELKLEATENFKETATFSTKVGSSTSLNTCITNTENFTTSAALMGAEGDLYAGVAINFIYGISDVLKYDDVTCTFKKDQDLNVFPKDFATTFIYSQFHILNDVIPALELTGETKSADRWREIVAANKTQKDNAIFEKNISFDSGVNYSSQTTSSQTSGSTFSFEVEGSLAFAQDGEFKVNGAGPTHELIQTLSFGASTETGREDTKERTVGYTLADDDIGDNFTVDIKKDPIYGTPVFKLLSGESSCPHEENTLPRSKPQLTSNDGLLKVNVPANTPAVFELELGNLSPTDEEMSYDISMETGTNPDGAIVKIDGHVLNTPLTYRIPAGESRKVLLTIEKGPLAFSYSGINIIMESACETEAADAKHLNVDSLFVSSLAFGVNFIEPCSRVDIGFPLQDWVVTPAAENKLSITLNEYDKADEDLKLIRLQYRPIGGDGSWININETLKADLGDLFTIKEWNTELNKDGAYEIRAVAECNNVNLKPGISTIVKGNIERNPPELVGVPEPGDGTWDPGDEISITFNEPINCDKVVQADILANNTIGLYDATTNALVDAKISCVGNKLIIVPNINPVFFENRTFRVVVAGKDYDDAQLLLNPNHQAAAIRDKAGNMIPKTIKWEFAVNQNNLEWVGTDVIETNEVLKPFSVKRQIRNRGGSIASFRMESIPSWLTVTPSTGTLNPGQVADVTLTFQQDLLIGDYLDTLQMHGSKGDEPLLIDYRVRCPAPVYVVDNPAQYEGSMNMVVDLSIFGVTSTDPSDIIVAKIGGQVRGVGKVAYYRNLPADKLRWLTFMTIYGNSEDVGKPIEFHVWQGVKCNEYVEILEEFTYQEGALEGSPLEPAQIHVLNLVKKCIPLNKGFNWVSFNLNLGTGRNTFKNVLSSLKTKDGAYIKTDNNFAEYIGGTWDALDSLILPTKRYMLYVTGKDTVCFKGEPYKQNLFPITIKPSPQWNWLGYVPSTGMTVTQALKGLTALNGDIIKSQTLFAQYVAGVGWIGNLSFLEPLKGYLLKIGNAGMLTYPSGGAAFNSENAITPDALAAQVAQEAPMTYDFTKYQLTMNLIGKVNGIKIDAEDELRAYIDGKLVGVNKSIAYSSDKLFFQTIYYQDEQVISFKLFKADRQKEYELNQNVLFKGETLTGLVNDPFIFDLAVNVQPAVTIAIDNQVISQPDKVFTGVSIAAKVAENNANCTLFGVSTILPLDTVSKPTCTAQILDGNMSSVIKIKYNELSSFVSAGDAISFTNSVTGAVVGCGVFKEANSLFYATISGSTTATKVPIDVKYYSSVMKKSFTIKAGVTYDYNTRLGNAVAPFTIDVSPLTVGSDANGLITAVMRDTSWTGKYCVNAFAMNCTGYSDGQTSFCFQRLKQGDCVDLIVRKVSETEDKIIKAVSISSEALIKSGVKIDYQGGNQIELKPGFDTSTGAIFTGKIGGCNNR
ncbi:MAG: LamG domain-containing protein [Bacteroidota bacterium]